MLVPREHGAYGQLLFPLVSALLIGRPEEGAYLLAGAAAAAFLAHEPLLVVLGQRGSRAAREQRIDAQRSLALFGAFWLVSGIVAVAVLPRQALLCLAVPLVLAAIVAVVVFMHRERSTAGELLAATALTSASLPVAVAGDVAVRDALTLFVVFAAVFSTASVAVRGVIGRVSRAGGPPLAIGGGLAIGVVAALAALAVIDRLAPVAPYAALPVCAVALALTIKPPSPRYLRPIGWTLVGATTATALILVAALA
jgi:hypothetical protein